MYPSQQHQYSYGIPQNYTMPPHTNGDGVHASSFMPPYANGDGVHHSPAMPPHANGDGVHPTKEADDDLSTYKLPDLPPMSRTWGKHSFALVVQQAPVRARMCGFGDKDRRPITPAVIVKLLIYDSEHKEINYDQPLKWSRLVLSVDLWNRNGTIAENLVRPNEQAAAISAVGTEPYEIAPGVMSAHTQQHLQHYSLTNHEAFSREVSRVEARSQQWQAPQYGHNGILQQHALVGSAALTQSPTPPPKSTEPHKNLIGQTHTSLQQLNGLDGEKGLFFIFQDLSVRTENWFRLKCVLYAVGGLGLEGEPELALAPTPGGLTGTDLYMEAPHLASTFTKPFKVYSAKKFPGVVETTSWSSHLALQGIKIPIRNTESNKRKRGSKADDADGDDDNDDE